MVKIESPKPTIAISIGHPANSYNLLSKVSGGIEIGEISLGRREPCLLGTNVSDHAHIMVPERISVSDHTHLIDLNHEHDFSRPHSVTNPLTNPQNYKHYHNIFELTFMPPVIVNVIYNPPATIVFWGDGTKTVVKADDEDFDREKGLAMAFMKKIYGNKGNYFNEVKKWAWVNENG